MTNEGFVIFCYWLSLGLGMALSAYIMKIHCDGRANEKLDDASARLIMKNSVIDKLQLEITTLKTRIRELVKD